MSTPAIGIDPGQQGAIVALTPEGRCAYQARMPLREEPVSKHKTRKRIDPGALQNHLAEILRLLYMHCLRFDGGPLMRVFIEEQVATHNNDPRAARQGTQNAFVVGEGFGRIRGVVETMNFDAIIVRPQGWQGAVLSGCPGRTTKQRSIWRASQIEGLDLTPGLIRTPHDGLADAACIALWGLRQPERGAA